MDSEKNIILSVNKVKIYPGEVFDFVRVYFMEGFGEIEAKLIIVYKRRKDNMSISFSIKQCLYFTVNGGEMDLACFDGFDSNDLSLNDYFNKKNQFGLNFVDSFTVIKGNDGIENHRPNIDINQPIIGKGLDWMKSSIEKKKLELDLKELGRIDTIKKAKKEEHEEEEQKKISKILEEEEKIASNENSYETLTRHFLTLNQNLFEYALKKSKK